MSNVYDNIVSGLYDNKLKYPKFPKKPTRSNLATPADYREHADALEEYAIANTKAEENRIEYNKETSRLESTLRTDLATEFDILENPKESKVWELAWQLGHSSGYTEIYLYYHKLVELVK
jgi:hypothetical protein